MENYDKKIITTFCGKKGDFTLTRLIFLLIGFTATFTKKHNLIEENLELSLSDWFYPRSIILIAIIRHDMSSNF
ncbi:hypothetical protein BpHYR1_011237 [Brachionus plicatilis]|uniref:Uncharacterized protein n=1 Tax=Brachionus plicatilis TaxID=10195 RepID=A0A3M7SN73_BRAPC|nr:hypothetical protein BpHYR1_011237 [Brachionus plicatilis]